MHFCFLTGKSSPLKYKARIIRFSALSWLRPFDVAARADKPLIPMWYQVYLIIRRVSLTALKIVRERVVLTALGNLYHGLFSLAA